MLNLTLPQKHWITSIDENEMCDFFQQVRIECLQQLNVGVVDESKGKEIQHQVAALHKLEKAFISFRKQIQANENS